MTRNRKDRSFDAATELKDEGAIMADAVAQVGGSDQILDLEEGGGLFDTPSGSDGSRFDGSVIIDVTALDIVSNDRATLSLCGHVTSSPTFASDIKNVAILELADTAVASGGADDGEVGHYELGFTNEQNGVARRYARLFTDVTGTTPSIDYVAHLAKKA